MILKKLNASEMEMKQNQNHNIPACTALTLLQNAQHGDGTESDHRLVHLCTSTGETDNKKEAGESLPAGGGA